MKLIRMTGKTEGKFSRLCDEEVCAPENQYANRVQEIHIKGALNYAPWYRAFKGTFRKPDFTPLRISTTESILRQ